MYKLILSIGIILFANSALAISATTSAKISNGVALDRIQAYAGPNATSKKLGIVEPGTELIEFKTFMKTNPGLAMMEDNSWDRSIPFDRGAHVYIWEYLGDGFSKVVINDIKYNTKVARSKTECNRFGASPRYCWVRVVEEPEYYEWKQVALEEEGQKFWLLNRIIDGSGILVVRDEGIEKTKVVNTKYIKEEELKDKELPDDSKVKEGESEEDLGKDSTPLEEVLEKENLEEGSPESIMAKKLTLTPEERAIERQKAKAKLKKMISGEDGTEPSNITQQPINEDIFNKGSTLNSANNSLAAPINNDSTKETMQNINIDMSKGATRLELKANQPLSLTNKKQEKLDSNSKKTINPPTPKISN